VQFPVHQYGLIFRLVEESDARFILDLRTDKKLSQYISPVEDDLDAQVEWIKRYKEREKKGEEYYVLYEDEQHQPQGLVRLYNIKDKTFTSGSWLIRPGSDELTAIKSDLFIICFAFEELKMEECFIDVRKENKKTLKYHKRFLTEINEDELSVYMVLNRAGYQRKKEFLMSIIA